MSQRRWLPSSLSLSRSSCTSRRASQRQRSPSKQVSNGNPATGSDWNQGYGYQFWQCTHGAFRGDGAFGQYCVVMPEKDAVLAITSGVNDLQMVLTQVWEHILPALNSAPLPAVNETPLKQKLASLTIRLPEGKPASPTAKRVSGKTYRFETNSHKIQSLMLTAEGKRTTITLKDDKGEHAYPCGSGSWAKSTTPLDDNPAEKSALQGTWTDENTFVFKNCYYETPYITTITCKFSGEEVELDMKTNVGFSGGGRVQLKGRSA